MAKRYNFEIDLCGREVTTGEFHQSANYGAIVCEGDSLQELLDTATVDIIDQDGGELAVREADKAWMQILITLTFNDYLNDHRGPYED